MLAAENMSFINCRGGARRLAGATGATRTVVNVRSRITASSFKVQTLAVIPMIPISCKTCMIKQTMDLFVSEVWCEVLTMGSLILHLSLLSALYVRTDVASCVLQTDPGAVESGPAQPADGAQRSENGALADSNDVEALRAALQAAEQRANKAAKEKGDVLQVGLCDLL
jgi:hypothetical protein